MKEYRAAKRSRSRADRSAQEPATPPQAPGSGLPSQPASPPNRASVPQPSTCPVMDLRPGAVSRKYVIPRANSLAAAAGNWDSPKDDAISAALEHAMGNGLSDASGLIPQHACPPHVASASTTASMGASAPVIGGAKVPATSGLPDGRPPLPKHQVQAQACS